MAEQLQCPINLLCSFLFTSLLVKRRIKPFRSGKMAGKKMLIFRDFVIKTAAVRNNDLTSPDRSTPQHCSFFNHLVGWAVRCKRTAKPSRERLPKKCLAKRNTPLLLDRINLHGKKVHLRLLLYQNSWLWLFFSFRLYLTGRTKLTVSKQNFLNYLLLIQTLNTCGM